MSRSYKEHPFCKVVDQDFKKIANKKVRCTKDVPNYGAYKKNGLSWSIIDQRHRETWGEYKLCMQHICAHGWRPREFDERECWNDYQKWYVRK